MVLVLFLLGIVLIIAFISFLILLSTLRIDIKELRINSNSSKEDNISKNLLMYIGLYFLGKWKLLQIKIDNEKIEKMNVKEKIQKIDIQELKQKKLINIDTLKLLKKLPVNIEKFNLKLNIGTIDITLTTIINFIIILTISIILPQIIKKYDSEKYYYQIKPIYGNKNMVKLDFSGIIDIKIVHIIDILHLILKKERVNENERTSNRRTYDYSYE